MSELDDRMANVLSLKSKALIVACSNYFGVWAYYRV
jgi:hypothetical protein